MSKRETLGRYVLVEQIGVGGMAEVWKAHLEGPDGFKRTVALKRPLPLLSLYEGFNRTLVAEAKLAARLDHPNIVQVFSLEHIDSEYLLIMELIDGCDLRALLASLRAPPPPWLGVFVAREVCRALEYAHGLTDDTGAALSLVHRDISPSNIMLSRNGVVKLVDFGLGKALGDSKREATRRDLLRGKVAYMTPEQLDGHPIDHRADIYTTGVVLHEALTGRRLFTDASDLAIMRMVREGHVTAPSQVNPAVPEVLDRICAQAMARNLAERTHSARELATALTAVLAELDFGTEALAELVRSVVRRPVPKRSRTPTVSHASWDASSLPARSRSLLVPVVAIAAAALVGVGYFTMTKRSIGVPATVSAQPPPPARVAPTTIAAPPPARTVTPVPVRPVVARSHADAARRRPEPRPAVSADPDVAKGKLLDPFLTAPLKTR